MLEIGYIISLWHSLGLPYNYFNNEHINCSRVVVLYSVMNGLRTDGQTDMVFIKTKIIFKKCTILKFISCEKCMQCRK